jgi:hypothetical protein
VLEAVEVGVEAVPFVTAVVPAVTAVTAAVTVSPITRPVTKSELASSEITNTPPDWVTVNVWPVIVAVSAASIAVAVSASVAPTTAVTVEPWIVKFSTSPAVAFDSVNSTSEAVDAAMLPIAVVPTDCPLLDTVIVDDKLLVAVSAIVNTPAASAVAVIVAALASDDAANAVVMFVAVTVWLAPTAAVIVAPCTVKVKISAASGLVRVKVASVATLAAPTADTTDSADNCVTVAAIPVTRSALLFEDIVNAPPFWVTVNVDPRAVPMAVAVAAKLVPVVTV